MPWDYRGALLHAEGGTATLHDMKDTQAELIRDVHNFAPDGDGHTSSHSDLSQSWIAVADVELHRVLQHFADGDVTDDEYFGVTPR